MALCFMTLTDSMLEEPVPELYPFRFKDLPLSRALAMEDTLKLIEAWSSLRTSSAIIWNTSEFLEQPSLTQLQQHYQVPVFPVGPLHKMAQMQSANLKNEDDICISWLDKQAPNSVIYVSFGTVITMDEKELVEAAWGLANSEQPFLWVVRPSSVVGSEWIELLPEGFSEKIGDRGCIVKWAPQREVLAHGAVGGYLTHCGWNSTLESICEGVPMICRGRSTDQRVHSRYATYVWKVGLELNRTLERGEIEKAIRRMLLEKEGEELRQRALDVKEMVKACFCEGGSSYNSLNDLVELLST